MTKEAVEAVVPIINPEASRADARKFSETVFQLGSLDLRVAETIELNNFQTVYVTDERVQREIESAMNRDGKTVFFIHGGDGTINSIWNEIYRIFDPRGKSDKDINIILCHVLGGEYNVYSDIWGVPLRSDILLNTIRDGKVIRVDQEVATLQKSDQSEQVTSLALLSFGFIHASAISAREELRRRSRQVNRLGLVARTLFSGFNSIEPTSVEMLQDDNVLYTGPAGMIEVMNGPRMLNINVTSGSVFDGEMTVIYIPTDGRIRGLCRLALGSILIGIGIYNNRLMKQCKGDTFQLQFTDPVPFHQDAELQRDRICSAVITCQQGAVPFIVPSS